MITTSIETTNPTAPITVDGDNKITLSQTGASSGAGYVQFSLSTASDVTWWKGIKVFNANNDNILLLSTQDGDHGPDLSKNISVGSFIDTIRVEIWKAKEFGIHRNVQTIFFSLADCDGKNTLFHWLND